MSEKFNNNDASAEKSFELLLKNAEEGNESAMRAVAIVYDEGLAGKSPDKARAFYWWKKLAETGDAEGQFITGRRYFKGLGTEKNIGISTTYIKAAANQGYEPAMQFIEKAKRAKEKLSAIQNDLNKAEIQPTAEPENHFETNKKSNVLQKEANKEVIKTSEEEKAVRKTDKIERELSEQAVKEPAQKEQKEKVPSEKSDKKRASEDKTVGATAQQVIKEPPKEKEETKIEVREQKLDKEIVLPVKPDSEATDNKNNLTAPAEAFKADLDYIGLKTDGYIDGKALAAEEEYFFAEFSIVKEKAESHDPKAEKTLGDFYANGVFIPFDEEKATYWYNRAIKDGNPEGHIGLCFFGAPEVLLRKENYTKFIFNELTAAAEAGVKNKELLYKITNLGHLNAEAAEDIIRVGDPYLCAVAALYSGENTEYMMKYYQEAAKKILHLNKFLTRLKEVNFGDLYKDAIKDLTETAQKGCVESMESLGFLYLEGEKGLKKDYYKAVNWLRLAAKYGSVNANKKLIEIFCGGEYCSPNGEEAAKCLFKAAELGDEECKVILEQLKIKEQEAK